MRELQKAFGASENDRRGNLKLLWLTDLHLDRVSEQKRAKFFANLQSQRFDFAVITGDISNANSLCRDLVDLGRACTPRDVFFTLGNHDYHGSSFSAVDANVAGVCRGQANLRNLAAEGIVDLGAGIALIGHGGWADARAGLGFKTPALPWEARRIEDFRGRAKLEVFEMMEALGKKSAEHFRRLLPLALTMFRRVVVATHVPPYISGVYHNGKPCGPSHQAFFTNRAAGYAIRGIARRFPTKRLTVLCGHTHSRVNVMASETVEICVGGAKPGLLPMMEVLPIGGLN